MIIPSRCKRCRHYFRHRPENNIFVSVSSHWQRSRKQSDRAIPQIGMGIFNCRCRLFAPTKSMFVFRTSDRYHHRAIPRYCKVASVAFSTDTVGFSFYGDLHFYRNDDVPSETENEIVALYFPTESRPRNDCFYAIIGLRDEPRFLVQYSHFVRRFDRIFQVRNLYFSMSVQKFVSEPKSASSGVTRGD